MKKSELLNMITTVNHAVLQLRDRVEELENLIHRIKALESNDLHAYIEHKKEHKRLEDVVESLEKALEKEKENNLAHAIFTPEEIKNWTVTGEKLKKDG